MSRLRRLTLVLATVSLVAQALVVVGPTAVLAASTPPPCVVNRTPCPTFDFSLQTRTFDYQATDKAAQYEWRKTIGTDPFVIYSTAKSGYTEFPCSDIARGLIVTLIERNAAGKQTYIHTFPRIEKCPIEKLAVKPIVTDNGNGFQNVNWESVDQSYTDEYWFGPASWFDTLMSNSDEPSNVALTSTYQGDGIAPTTFDPTSGEIGDSSCTLFDKHLVASFVAKAVDGSVLAQEDVAIPPCAPAPAVFTVVATPDPSDPALFHLAALGSDGKAWPLAAGETIEWAVQKASGGLPPNTNTILTSDHGSTTTLRTNCADLDTDLVVEAMVMMSDGSAGDSALDIAFSENLPLCPATSSPSASPSGSPSVTANPSSIADVTATPTASVTPTANPDPISPARHAEATRDRIIGTIAFVLAGLITFFGIYLPRRRRRRK